MREQIANLFDYDCDAACITTNGFIKLNGHAVLGRGCALTAAQLFPNLPYVLGKFLSTRGNHVHELLRANGTVLCSFPVKAESAICNGFNTVSHGKYRVGERVPGFHLKADLELIARSANELLALADFRGWNNIALPRAGCGAGELDWETVKPVLNSILDDRFVALTL